MPLASCLLGPLCSSSVWRRSSGGRKPAQSSPFEAFITAQQRAGLKRARERSLVRGSAVPISVAAGFVLEVAKAVTWFSAMRLRSRKAL
jgi:hypothetical protein